MFSICMKRSRAALLVLAVGLVGIANAEGPAVISALPGGGGSVISDNDLGNGQRWGRAGGRTITYHVNNPSTFAALSFGVVQGTAPSLAFDGAVTNATGEVMSYTAGQSNLGAGVARWTGFANLPLVNGVVNNLPTRFTITVTRTNGAAVPLAFDASGSNPMASVLATGDFRVNLLFEMQDLNAPAGFYQPVLDYYDNLQGTIPGQPPATNVGPVMTGVSTAFYYTLADTGMTIEEHDAHLQALFDSIKPKINNIDDKINFLKTDWDGRIPAIQTAVSDVKNALNNQVTPTLNQIQQQVAQLLGQGSGTGNLATKQDLQGIQEMLMIVLGVMPCPVNQAPPGFCTNFGSLAKLGADSTQILVGLNNAHGKLDSAAGKLNTLATQASVDGIVTGLSQANTAIGGKASQSSVDGILIGLSQATTAIGSKSSQVSVDALAGRLDGLESAVAELQATLDNTASQSLDVRAVQVDSGDPKKLRWIVKITRDGALVNASLTRFATVRGYSAMANVMANAVITSLGTGLHDVVLSITKDAPEGVAYLFEAKIIGPIDIVGSALMVTEKKGASPF